MKLIKQGNRNPKAITTTLQHNIRMTKKRSLRTEIDENLQKRGRKREKTDPHKKENK